MLHIIMTTIKKIYWEVFKSIIINIIMNININIPDRYTNNKVLDQFRQFYILLVIHYSSRYALNHRQSHRRLVIKHQPKNTRYILIHIKKIL